MSTYDDRYTSKQWKEQAEASVKLSQERRVHERRYFVPPALFKGLMVLLLVACMCGGFWWFVISSVS